MAMAYVASSLLPVRLHRNPISLHLSPSLRSFPSRQTTSLRPVLCVRKPRSPGGKLGSQDACASDFLRKPTISPDDDGGGSSVREKSYKGREEEEWVDWEDQILEDTVPLVGYVRMIIHSGKYENGDRLSLEHEKFVLEKLLAYHPECEKKIGCGIDYITVGYHPDFEGSRCLFIVRNDGELVDFSYWKCVKGLIRKKYPQYADSFILRHFQRRYN